MRGSEFAELKMFAAVAERLNFSRAAEQLGMSPSALSQTIRALEARLGTRLLNRTTRSVILTEAGSRLLGRIAPLFTGFEEAIREARGTRGEIAGTLKLCAPQLAILHILQPVLPRFRDLYPDVILDITSDDSVEDIVSRGFDAGVRLGKLIEKDMVAVRISEALHQIAVAAPSYLASHGRPAEPIELLDHRCINWRRPGRAEVYTWAFEKADQTLNMNVTSAMIVNDCTVALQSAIDGLGVTVWIREWVEDALAAGRLVPLLEDWTPPPSSFYLYHPSQRHVPPPLRAFTDTLLERP